MNTRLLVSTLFILLIIGGLAAGLFAGSIQRALTLPAMRDMMNDITGRMPTATVPAVATPTAATTPVQAATNILAQDTFQRTNQALWGTASDGLVWNGDANNPKDQPIFSIVGTTGQIARGQGTFDALLGPQSSNAEVVLTGSVNRFGGGVNLGSVLRWVDNNNLYKAFIDGTHLVIIKRVKGVNTVLGSVPFLAQGAMTYQLRFRAVGTMLLARAWRNNQAEPVRWMLTATDTTLTSGQVGVRVLLQNETIVNLSTFMATTV